VCVCVCVCVCVSVCVGMVLQGYRVVLQWCYLLCAVCDGITDMGVRPTLLLSYHGFGVRE
jgi:hypothetical protein